MGARAARFGPLDKRLLMPLYHWLMGLLFAFFFFGQKIPLSKLVSSPIFLLIASVKPLFLSERTEGESIVLFRPFAINLQVQ